MTWAVVKRLWKAVAAAAAVIGVVTTVVFGPIDLYRRLFPAKEVISPMTGDVNVAVARFTAGSDEDDLGVDLARSMHGRLGEELGRTVGQRFEVQTRTPEQTGAIAGSPDQQASAARTRAAELKADLLVYGNLATAVDKSSLQLRLYVSPQLVPGAEELIGQYELGMSATVRGDAAHNFVLRDDLRTSAVAGTTALAEFATGLLFYSAGKYPDADRWFVQAGRGSSVLADRGVMLRLFRGNVQLRIGRPAEARREFAAALDLQPDNARASVGLAESALLAGNGGCTKEKIDPTGVRTAVRLYQQAMRARVQPRESDVPVKVMSGLGRAYLCLSQAGVEDRWGPAREHLERVLQAYQTGNERLRELAAEAYGSLGLLCLPVRGATDGAAVEALRRSRWLYERAVELSRRPEREGVFLGMVGFVTARLSESLEAEAAYARAADLDPARKSYYQAAAKRVAQEILTPAPHGEVSALPYESGRCRP